MRYAIFSLFVLVASIIGLEVGSTRQKEEEDLKAPLSLDQGRQAVSHGLVHGSPYSRDLGGIGAKEQMLQKLDTWSNKLPGHAIVIFSTTGLGGMGSNGRWQNNTELFFGGHAFSYYIYALKDCGDYFHLTGDGGWKNWGYALNDIATKVDDKLLMVFRGCGCTNSTVQALVNKCSATAETRVVRRRRGAKEQMEEKLGYWSRKLPGHEIVIVWQGTGHATNVNRVGFSQMKHGLYAWTYNVYALKHCAEYFHLTGDGGWKNWGYTLNDVATNMKYYGQATYGQLLMVFRGCGCKNTTVHAYHTIQSYESINELVHKC